VSVLVSHKPISSGLKRALYEDRLADLWDGLYVRLLSLVPGFLSDRDLLWLAFPPCPLGTERLVVAHLGLLVAEIWETRSFLRPPYRAELAAAFRGHFPALRCLF
jgi:hypothetical protein